MVGGGLNVYPRPDDPFAPIGQANSSDQLGSLYAPSLGLTNLWNVLQAQAPEAAYVWSDPDAPPESLVRQSYPARSSATRARDAGLRSIRLRKKSRVWPSMKYT